MVGAPTFTTATLPDSEPIRSASTSSSTPKVAFSFSASSWVTRAWTTSGDPTPPMTVVRSAVTRTCAARPSWARVIVSIVEPECFDSTVPPVTVARSSSLRSRRSP